MEHNKIVTMAVDLYKGSLGNFSHNEVETTLREAFNDLLGAHKNMRRAFKSGGTHFFTVLEDILDVLIVEGLENQFAQFVDLRTPKFGDKPVFMVPDYHLFKVATVASGNNTVRRQRLDRNGFTVPTFWKSVKIYEEMENFLAGRINWTALIQKVYRSHEAQIAADINQAIVTGYSGLDNTYKVSGAWDLTKFNDLVQHVEAATGHKAMVVGNRSALQKAVPAYVGYNGSIVEGRNNDGFFKVIDGTTLFELRQSHIPGTDTFAISNQLLVLPVGEEKIVKMVAEGESMIEDSNATNNKNQDDSVEFSFKKKYGVGVVTSSKYGVYLPS